MTIEIYTIEDVKIFAKHLIFENVRFHPDDDFNDYVNIKTNLPTYTKEEANLRNALMKSCFLVCENEGVDVYEVMHEVRNVEPRIDRIVTFEVNTLK